MGDAKAAICYMNGLTLQTISEVEKILLSLPQKGDKCELQTARPYTKSPGARGTGDVVKSKNFHIRDVPPKPLTLSPQSSAKKCKGAPKQEPSKQEQSKKCTKSKDSKSTSGSAKSVKSRNSICSRNYQPARNVEYRALGSVCESAKRTYPKSFNPSVCTSSASNTNIESTPKFRVGNVRVSPITDIIGVILDVDVEITKPNSTEKKQMKLEIECPNYKPTKIRVDGKWKKIV